uniref:Tick transposon n=1 Tax=Rhipicephalus appendiculatus TaxID=34631 RepID=A0A131YFT7_RHIAP
MEKARVHVCYSIIRKKELGLYFLRVQLEYQMSDVFEYVEAFARKVATTANQVKQTSLKKKLTALKKSKEPRNESRTINSVVNLSLRQRSRHETNVLSKGHSFNATAPRRPQIIATVEDGVEEHLDNKVRESVRIEAIGILLKLPTRPRENLTKPEKAAMQEL